MSATDEREVVTDPTAFADGRKRALREILALLDELPEGLASRTRDGEGRGAAYAVSLVRPFVQRLLDDPTWLPDLENA